MKVNIGIIILFTITIIMIGCISPELRTARIAINEEDWNRALKALNEEIARMPTNDEAYYLKGYAYQKLNDWARMSEAYDQSLELSTRFKDKIDDDRLRLVARYDNMGVDAYNEQEWEKSIAYIDTAITINPHEIELYQRATAFSYYGDYYDKALKYGLESIRREQEDEKDIPTREYIIAIYREREDHKETIKWCNQLKTLIDPATDTTEAYLNPYIIDALVEAYEGLEDHDNAERIIEEAIKTYPENVPLKMSMVYIMIQREQFDNAAEILSDILAIEPDNQSANINLGKILINRKEYSEAIKYLEKAVELDESNVEVLRILASAYYNTGQDEKGQKLLEKAESIQNE